MPYGDIDFGSDNGLLPDSTKPLLEPLLTEENFSQSGHELNPQLVFDKRL